MIHGRAAKGKAILGTTPLEETANAPVRSDARPTESTGHPLYHRSVRPG